MNWVSTDVTRINVESSVRHQDPPILKLSTRSLLCYVRTYGSQKKWTSNPCFYEVSLQSFLFVPLLI